MPKLIVIVSTYSVIVQSQRVVFQHQYDKIDVNTIVIIDTNILIADFIVLIITSLLHG